MIEKLSPEIRLMCCLLNEKSSSKTDIAALTDEVDWEHFLSSATFHRLNGMLTDAVHKSAAAIPGKVIETLEARLRTQEMRSLAQQAETDKLQSLFSDHNVPLVFIKGISLSKLLYDNISVRSSFDIDLLIGGDDLFRADKLLLKMGYKRISPDKPLTSRMHRICKNKFSQYKYLSPGQKVLIELHWKLHNYCGFYPDSLHDFSENSLVEAEDCNWKTISRQDYVLYLCAHGSKHCWAQLYWIKDIAIILNKWKDIDWRDLRQSAEEHQMMRPLCTGLLLAKELFGATLPQSFTDIDNSRGKINDLLGYSLAALQTEVRAHLTLGQYLLISKNNLAMRPGFRHKVQVLLAQLSSYHDWEVLPLPEKLFFLYYPLRPFLWSYRRFRRKRP